MKYEVIFSQVDKEHIQLLYEVFKDYKSRLNEMNLTNRGIDMLIKQLEFQYDYLLKEKEMCYPPYHNISLDENQARIILEALTQYCNSTSFYDAVRQKLSEAIINYLAEEFGLAEETRKYEKKLRDGFSM